MSGYDDFLKAIGGNDKIQSVEAWLSCGYPPLNKAVSGDYFKGFPVGRIVEIAGPESSGKTRLATEVMISAQKAGGMAIFMDHERSFDAEMAEEIGLDLTPGPWVFKKPKTFESSVASAQNICSEARERKVITPDAPIVVVFDSLASMVPQSKFAKGIEDHNMADMTALARATSSAMPALAMVAEQFHALLIFLNQIRDVPGVVYGPKTSTPGGKALKYYASVRIQLSAKKITEKDGASSEVIGQQVTAECIKNKVARPFEKADWTFIFGDDGVGRLDVVASMVDYLVSEGKIDKSGKYLVWEGKNIYQSVLVKKLSEADDGVDQLTKLLGA